MRSFLFFSLLFFLVSRSEFYFGKNKVQSKRLHFQMIESPDFVIYFPSSAKRLAFFAKRVCEEQCDFLKRSLNVKVKDKVPVILYSSFSDFSETNVVLDLIEEGVGGFSEFLKRRVVVPFDGSYRRFERVLRHEVSHIFLSEFFSKRKGFSLFEVSAGIPFFVSEGFCEWAASRFLGSDDFSEFFLRDYVVNNRFSFEELMRDRSFLSYRLGETFFGFVSERYGEEKVFEFLKGVKRNGFAESFKSCFGKKEKSFFEDFSEYLKVKYLPLYSLSLRESLFTSVLPEKNVLFPVIAPKGDKVLFLLNGDDPALCLVDLSAGRIKRKRVFKGLRVLRRVFAMSSFPEEEIAVFLSRNGERVLEILSSDFRLKRRFVVGLDDCFEPSFSPDGREIVFCGVKDGGSDLYRIEVESGRVTRLTFDSFDEFSPSFSPDGETIFFARSNGRRMAICALGVKGWRVEERAGGFSFVSDPICLSSGEVLFISEGRQIFMMRNGEFFRTNLFSGFFNLSIGEGDKVCFSYYKKGGYRIGLCNLEVIKEILEPVSYRPEEVSLVSEEEGESGRPIGFSLSADFISGGLSFTPGFFSGYCLLALSDILGDHRFYLMTDLSGVIDFSNFYLSYWYLKERIDYNLTVYQFTDGFETSDLIYLWRERLLSPLVSYPISREKRVETGIMLLSSNTWVYEKRGEEFSLLDSYSSREFPYFLSYVFDDTKAGVFGPRKGERGRVSGEVSFWGRNYLTTYLDLRSYLNLFSDYILALRFFGIGSFGREPDSFSLGGEVCRGYDYYEFHDSTGNFLAQTQIEFRFPLIEEIKFGFPPVSFKGIGGRVFLDGAFLLGLKWRKIFGAGFGITVFVPPFPIRLDFSYPLSETEEKRWHFSLFLGEEF